MEEVSNRVYEIMQLKLMSQAAVARAIGETPQSFNDMLRGRKQIRIRHIPKICEALDCEPNELFGFKKQNHQITVTGHDGEVIAVVVGDSVVEHEGYHVALA